MKKEVINTDLAPKAIGPYSQGIIVKDFIFVSGQLPIDVKSGDMPINIKDQALKSLENIKAILEASGSDMDKIVKTTVLLTDLNDFGIVNEVYGSFFKGEYPARACYEVKALPKGAKIEIEAIAYK